MAKNGKNYPKIELFLQKRFRNIEPVYTSVPQAYNFAIVILGAIPVAAICKFREVLLGNLCQGT